MVERGEIPGAGSGRSRAASRRSARRDEWARSAAGANRAELPVLGRIAGRKRLPAPLVDDVLVVRIRGADGLRA